MLTFADEDTEVLKDGIFSQLHIKSIAKPGIQDS